MRHILNIIQVIVSVLLITVILIQGRGAGLGAAFGGSSNVYRTKRGAEKFLHICTIVLAFIFIVVAFVNIIT
jgi:preprotein translocase subunit SecG